MRTRKAILIVVWVLVVTGYASVYPEIRSIEGRLVADLREAAEQRRIGSAALVLMRGGRIVSNYQFGARGNVYQLASVSKAVTAFGIMRLVEERRIALDEPVMRHLKRWRFPGSEAYRDRVTVRHLLSHTAGLDDGLGYSGFAPGERVQTIVESLNDPEHPIRVTREPGTALAYSGGGYTVLQLLIEDVTGEPFAAYMKRAVLQPLGMYKATFDFNELTEAPVTFDKDVKPATPRRHTALAAVSLYATPYDMGPLLLALSRAQSMMEPQPGTSGRWGLGLTLYPGGIAGHDGGSPPAWGAMVRLNPVTGNGMAILVSGGEGAINHLSHDWLYAETGIVTLEARRQLLRRRARWVLSAIALGVLAIVAQRVRA